MDQQNANRALTLYERLGFRITVEDLENYPYPVYARLRREEPVAWVPAVNCWLVTRADDVETVTAIASLAQDLVDRHPWLPRELLVAFRAAKDLAFARMRDPRRVSLAWFAEAMAEQRRILGDDPWAYDFARNRAGLAMMIRWSREQGMLAREFEPEGLFHPSVLAELPTYV